MTVNFCLLADVRLSHLNSLPLIASDLVVLLKCSPAFQIAITLRLSRIYLSQSLPCIYFAAVNRPPNASQPPTALATLRRPAPTG